MTIGVCAALKPGCGFWANLVWKRVNILFEKSGKDMVFTKYLRTKKTIFFICSETSTMYCHFPNFRIKVNQDPGFAATTVFLLVCL